MTSSAIIFSLTQKNTKKEKNTKKSHSRLKKAFRDAARYSGCTVGWKTEQDFFFYKNGYFLEVSMEQNNKKTVE